MVYGTQLTIVTGAYKPTNITGGPHIVAMQADPSTNDLWWFTDQNWWLSIATVKVKPYETLLN